MRKILIFAAVILCLSTGALGQIAGKVIAALGRVEVQQSGRPFVAAANNQTLNAGDVVRTGPQSRAVILLADETQLKLNANTQLQLQAVRQTSNLLVRVAQAGARADQSILNLSSGEAWLRSRKTPASMRVTTPAVTAAIRGTEFDLRVAGDGESVVTVLEGSVDYRNDQGFVFVNSGEQGRARPGQAPTKTVILNPRDAVQWTLFYSGSVSPRDYPFVFASLNQAKNALAGASAGDPVRLAQIRHDAGDSDGALKALEGVASAEAAETRGWILLEQNRIREALQQLSQAPTQSPRTRLGLSLAHYRLNEFDEAYRYVQDPGNDSRLKLQKATLELIAGDAAGSRSLLQSIPQDDAAYTLAQGLLSNVYLTQNNKDQARQAAQRAVAANPDSPSAYLNLSLVQQSFFDLPAATQSAERALALDPSFLQAQVQYAKLLFGAGDSGKAERVTRQALATAPEEAAAHSTLGFILLGQAKTTAARTEFETSIKQDPTRGDPHLGLGIAAMRQGQETDAVAEMLVATTLEPQLSLYQSYLGKAFYEERKFEQAFTALKAAMELDPRDPTPYLYSGIFQNDLNRPGIAVEDFLASIRLNDNRAVYRSRFVLDEDRATRNVNLATAYNRLGLSEWANVEAIKSILADPANSSAHLFLAGTFLNLKGRTLAAGGELLLTRLLLPVNTNSFNAFNDYTTLFDLPRLNWTSEGRAGSFSHYGETLISSGGASRYAYSSVVTSDHSKGFRPLNDDTHSHTAVTFFKFALTPHSDMLLSYSNQQSRDGDHGIGELVDEENDPNRRAFVRRHRAELGYHQRFRPGSDLVLYFSGQTTEQVFDDPDAISVRGIIFSHRDSNRIPFLNLQAEHLLKVSRFQFKYGVDIFEGRLRDRRVERNTKNGDLNYRLIDRLGNSTFSSPDDRDLYGLHKNARYKTAFLQSDYTLTPKLILTAGLNYDWSNDNNVFDDFCPDRPISKWDPQGGILFSPFESTTFRFAAMRVLQTHLDARLVPTHINGFVLHENEFELSQSTSYNLGWDQRYEKNSFIRTTAFWKKRTTPIVGVDGPIDFLSHFYGGGIVLNHFLTDSLTLVPEYTITHSEDLRSLRHDHEGRVGLFYIHPRGYFFQVQQRYLNQHGRFLGDSPEVSAFTTDAAISYEMPRKLGLISFRATNLFDRRYQFLADPLALDPRIPRRELTVTLRFNLSSDRPIFRGGK
ncbi:MAG TPA: TonB-dependent receptor [Acidobacteriota bacterium]|nr:TonB-dependent receptor [Acidobacteriota bacterium]